MSVHSRIELEFGNVGFRGEGKTGVPGEKTSRSGVENQQQTQPTYDGGSGRVSVESYMCSSGSKSFRIFRKRSKKIFHTTHLPPFPKYGYFPLMVNAQR